MIYLIMILTWFNVYFVGINCKIPIGDELVEPKVLTGNRLKFVTKFICSDLDMAEIDLNNSNVLFLCSKDMLIITRLQDDNDKDIRNSILLMKEFESFGLSPLMTILNDTYSAIFAFQSKLNYTVLGWTLSLTRQSVTGYESVPPIILLPYKVYIEFPNHLYQTKTILTDFFAEPFLRWTICCPVDFNFIRKYIRLIDTLESTCAGSGLFTVHVVHVLHKGIIFGLEYSGKITYYNLASLDNENLCKIVDCGDLFLVDAIMTTRHFVILTNKGILVSNDLLNATNSWKQEMTFTLQFNKSVVESRVLKEKFEDNYWLPSSHCSRTENPRNNIVYN